MSFARVILLASAIVSLAFSAIVMVWLAVSAITKTSAGATTWAVSNGSSSSNARGMARASVARDGVRALLSIRGLPNTVTRQQTPSTSFAFANFS